MSEGNLQKKQKEKHFFVRITNRLILFLFTYASIVFVFFLYGNFQFFLNSSQDIILATLAIVSIVLLCWCVIGIVVSIVYAFIEKRWKYLLNILFYCLFVVCALVFLLLSTGIQVLSSGTDILAQIRL